MMMIVSSPSVLAVAWSLGLFQVVTSFGSRPTRHSFVASKPRQVEPVAAAVGVSRSRSVSFVRAAVPNNNNNNNDTEEYRNAATQILSNFMTPKDTMAAGTASKETFVQITNIDFLAPKVTNLPLVTLAQALDAELYTSEWFVTGRVNPIYFADSFTFQDPDVKLSGIEEYAKGVNKLFDQETARAEIISTIVSSENTITCTWRLSGKVNIGPGLTIKPYIVFTDFTVDAESGLIVFQEDRFDLPQWDILLSALFPFLIGRVTSSPAPIPDPRDPPPAMPRLNMQTSPLQGIKDMLGALMNKQ